MIVHALVCGVCGATFADDNSPSPRCPYCAYSYYEDDPGPVELSGPTRDNYPVAPPESLDDMDNLSPQWARYQIVATALQQTGLDEWHIHNVALRASTSPVGIPTLLKQAHWTVSHLLTYGEVPVDLTTDGIAESFNLVDYKQNVEALVEARGRIQEAMDAWDSQRVGGTVFDAIASDWATDSKTPEGKRMYNRLRQALRRLRQATSKNNPTVGF